MNARELFTADGKSAGVYYCEACNLVSRDKQFADECCVCRHCNKPYDRKKEFSGGHSACWREDRTNRQRKRLDEAELVENYTGPIYLIEGWGRDGFVFDDIDEVLADNVESPEDWPQFAFCCELVPFPKADYDDILQRCAENLYEDAYDDITLPQSLIVAIEEFNAANKHLHTYNPDYKHKVQLPPMPTEHHR